MSMVPIAFFLVLFGLFSIRAVQAFRMGSIDTKLPRIGEVRSAEKPFVFWLLIIGWLCLNALAAYFITSWAMSK